MKKLLSLILVITLLCSMSLPALAADKAIGATLRLEKTEGTVAVKNASGKAQSVKASMRLYSGYTTATEKKSYAYISLDDSKVVKLDALSEVEVQQSGKKLEVMLSKGSLMFDVSEKLKSDESLNIRTSTMLTGVRGTIGVVTVRGITVDLSKYDKVVLENGDIMYLDKLTGECVFLLKGNGELYQSADGSTQNVTLLGNVGNTRNQNVLSISATDIYLLEGELEVKTISGQTVTLTAGQKATVDQVDGTGEVIIRIDEAKLTDTNGSAQMMIADSPEIQQRLSEGGVYTPEQVKEAVENAPEALKREQAEQEASLEGPAQRDKSVVPAFENNTPESNGGTSAPTYAVTFMAGEGGAMTVNGRVVTPTAGTTIYVPQGSDYMFTLAPATGYKCDDVPDFGVESSATSSDPEITDSGDYTYTLSGITGDTTVHVFGFELITYQVTLNVNGGEIDTDTYTDYEIAPADTSYINDSAGSDASVTLPIPTKTFEIGGTNYDCTFEGWYANEEFSGERVYAVPAGTTVSKDYYAKWSVTLTNPTYETLQGALGYEGIPVFYLSGTAEINNAPTGDPTYIVAGVTLNVTAGSKLTISSPLEIYDGAVLVNNGTIVNNNTITVAGTLTNNGTVDGPGSVTVTGTGTFDGSNPLTPTP